MDELSGVSRKEIAGWPESRLHQAIVKLGAIKEPTPDQEAVLAFLVDAAMRRKEDQDFLNRDR